VSIRHLPLLLLLLLILLLLMLLLPLVRPTRFGSGGVLPILCSWPVWVQGAEEG